MDRADRYVNGLVFVHEPYLVSDRDFGDSAHYNPMFRAVEVLLQGQPPAGIDADSLHLVACPEIRGLVEAPRPVDPPMLQGLVPVARSQVLDQLLHALG